MISNIPENQERFVAPGATTLAVSWTSPTASDNSEIVTLTSTKMPGDEFDLGITTVTYTAVDPSNNMVMRDFTVTLTSMLKISIVNVSVIFGSIKVSFFFCVIYYFCIYCPIY